MEIGSVSVPSIGVVAGRPEMKAGLELSKFVLWIVSATIVVFGTYLIIADVMHRASLAEAYRRVYAQVENGGEVANPSGIQPLIARLRNETGNALALSKDEVEAVRDFARSLYRARIVSDRQRSAIEACAADLNAAQVIACSDLLDTSVKASSATALNLEKIRALSDFTKSIDESQKSFHGFWLQVAQLILLNLLLPLLTGLFGYIFGTTQVPAATKQGTGSAA